MMKTSICNLVVGLIVGQVLLGIVCADETARLKGASKENAKTTPVEGRPNILFLFSDDHAIKAISASGGPLAKIAPTPNIDRLAREGVLFRNSFCANSICGPSRATILTGKHSHINGFLQNTNAGFDQTQWTVAKALQAGGYNTAVIGKWHLKSDPVGFDHWEILPGQGDYYNPVFLQQNGSSQKFEGYATDLTTDKALSWLDQRDKSKPFFLMCQHKAPHRTFAPALRHLGIFDGVEIPEPETLFDDYQNRSRTLAANEMEIDRHFDWAYDAKVRKDERGGVILPGPDRYGSPEYNRMSSAQKHVWDAHFGPRNQAFLADVKAGRLSEQDIVRWKYRRYMENYLGAVRAVDESVGRMLQYLEDNGLADNTIVVYSSDQGFYLGEHGWYDKRWMFEESFRMPLIVRWPGVGKPSSTPEQLVQNIDYAPTFMEMAGLETPVDVQGQSLVPILNGSVTNWRTSLFYAYYEVGEHAVPQHFGVRTKRHKLIRFPATSEWNLFDLELDPNEMRSVHDDPNYQAELESLTREFHRLRVFYDAPPLPDDPWTIDSHDDWQKNAAAVSDLVFKDGIAQPTGPAATFQSVLKTFPTKRAASAIVFDQSPVWQNWEPVENIGPSNLADAPVMLNLGPKNYWMFGMYQEFPPQKNAIRFVAQPATLAGFDGPLWTTIDPHQFNAPGGLKPDARGYHAWQSRDMVHWVHHGSVTERFARWVTSAEFKDGKVYIFYDYPNDQDPHVYLDEDLTDGVPGKNLGMAFKDPSDGSDAGFIRDLDGNFHVIYEDYSPIDASKRSWDSPLAGHAVSTSGIKDYKILSPAVDNRTQPTGKMATYKHPHWKSHPDWDTNVGEYEIHEPEQEAYGDWAAICIGGQYYLFGDYEPSEGHEMSVGWFTSPSLDQQFTWCDHVGEGHPDPDIGFAEGRFYLVTQRDTDFVSPGPWVESVAARVGVDTDNDGQIDQWSGWQTVTESYDYIPGFAKQIQKKPAAIDLARLPAGFGFQFELKIKDTTENKSQPLLDKIVVSFEDQ